MTNNVFIEYSWDKKMASVYEGMTDAEKNVADCLQESGLWWWYEFPVFVFDEKEIPRVWTPTFYIPKLGMFIEVSGNKREDYDYREKIFKKNGYHIIFLHLYKKDNDWKKYLVQKIMKIEELRHSEIKKMVGQVINRIDPSETKKSVLNDITLPNNIDEIKKNYPRAYENWTENEDRQIMNEYNQGKSIPQIAIIHQRKTDVIRSRLRKLGLISEIRK